MKKTVTGHDLWCIDSLTRILKCTCTTLAVYGLATNTSSLNDTLTDEILFLKSNIHVSINHIYDRAANDIQ